MKYLWRRVRFTDKFWTNNGGRWQCLLDPELTRPGCLTKLGEDDTFVYYLEG